MKRFIISLSLFLPILFFMGCDDDSEIKNHIIAKIPEASGISYCENSDTLVVANDEGKFYEIDKSGKILNTNLLGKFDLEGVVCEEDRFVFALEDGKILTVERKTLTQNLIAIEGLEKLKKNSGIEGIAKIGKKFILSSQSKEKEDARLIIINLKSDHAKVEDMIKSEIIDSSGLEYKDDKLYVVSDKKDKLYLFDIDKKKILKKIDLPPFAVEGLTFDNDENIWFSDDDGAVLRYKFKDL
ncbi:MAG: hypothetical protein KN64_10265 [Sulfurovum sp. AS07-7]|nr:MAG: hypothetical protein KN64_10265 [Sulfurovum sp. AS07-7]